MKYLFVIMIIMFASCGNPATQAKTESVATKQQSKERFPAPSGYRKVQVKKGSFAEYLRNLPLKKPFSDLHYYNGSIKSNHYEGAVVDIDFGHNQAEQCADAVIFLRAQWLWKTKQYNKIHFNFDNGFRADYVKWAEGQRIHVNTRNWVCTWRKDAKRDYSYATFRKYLSLVFVYAGTASLSRELKRIQPKDLTIGDVLINGGYPGHVVIIVDEIVNAKGEKALLLAQGYTPAQEIEIFNNWFPISQSDKEVVTPGWIFKGNYAMRFNN